VIIKAVRVAARRVPALCAHLLRGDENDRVTLLRGSEADMRDWRGDADRRQCAYAVRQFIIAPKQAITREQAFEVIALLAGEFGFPKEGGVVVEHAKPRATDDAHDIHWHLCVPEVDAVSGRVLSSSHDRPRHEYVARVAEARFGHTLTPGAHNGAVGARLRREGHSEIADRLEAGRVEGTERPRQAYAHADHQKATRFGVDMPALRLLVAAAARERVGCQSLAEKLAANGLALKPGERAGEWIVVKGEEFVASVRRLAGMRVAEFRNWTEDWSGNDRGRNPGADEGNTHRRRDAKAPGGNPGGSGRAERDELPSGDARHSGEAGLRPDRPAKVDLGAAQGSPGARNRRGAEAHPLGRLIAPVEHIARRAKKLSCAADECAVTDEAYLRHCCDKFDADARAAIETVQRRAGPTTEALDAAKSREDQARAQAETIRGRQLGLYDERAALKKQIADLGFWERRRIGPALDQRLDKLNAEGRRLEAAGKDAQRSLSSAMATHAHAEKAHLASLGEAARVSAEVAAKQRHVISTVAIVRSLFRHWPDLARLGPSACYQLGEQIARKKSQLMNPNAKDIWGIPLAWDP